MNKFNFSSGIGFRRSLDTRTRQLKALFILAGCGFLFVPVSAFAEPVTKIIDAMHISISFDSPVSFEKADELVVELDGYDATALSSLQANRLDIKLDTRLATGDHQLTLLLFRQNGEIVTLHEETITHYQAPGIKSAQTQHNVTLQNSYRLDESEADDFGDIPRFNSQGAAQLVTRLESDKWLLNAELDALYDRQKENNPSGTSWELPHYRIQASHGAAQRRLTGTLGVVDLQRNSLAVNDFFRRGLALSVQNSERYGISVFGLQSTPRTEIDSNLAWPEDSNERTLGATAYLVPLRAHPQKLQLSLEYVDGDTNLGGTGIQVDDQQIVYGGHTWNIAADSVWRSGAIWFHGEYSEAKFDSDGLTIGEGAATDQAHNLFVEINSTDSLTISGLDQWGLIIQRQEVGRDYYSVSNLALPGDLRLDRAAARIARGGLSLDAEWIREQNNLDGREDIARQTTRRSGVTASYQPWFSAAPARIWQILGQPGFSGYYYRSSRTQPREDSLRVGYDLDNSVDEFNLAASFSHEYWNWGVQHTLIETDDRSREIVIDNDLLYEPQPDSRDRLTQLQLGWTPNQRIALNTYVQWSKLTEAGTGQSFRNTNSGFDTQIEVLPGRVSLSAGYNLSRDESRYSISDFDSETKSQAASLGVSWQAMRGDQHRPGLLISLDGSYGKQSDIIFDQSQKTWQVLLNFDLQWSGGTSP